MEIAMRYIELMCKNSDKITKKGRKEFFFVAIIYIMLIFTIFAFK